MDKRHLLERIFLAGVAACGPERVLPPNIQLLREEKATVLAVGKAAAGMAKVVEEEWRGPLSGLAVAPHGESATLRRIALMTAAHPVPDASSIAAAEALLDHATEAREGDLVLVLLSGGASSLACLPAEGMTLEQKQALTAALLSSGAPIAEINCVRRHLSRIKGGRLARAAQPARLVTLAISDIPTSATEDIGSGPTVADPTRCEDARAVLEARGFGNPFLPWSESVKRDEASQWHQDFRIIASGADAVDAAAAEAERLGYAPEVIGYDCEGEARLVGKSHAAQALARTETRAALISGGELTVTAAGSGAGGPNREYLLGLAKGLGGAPGICAVSGDTDGIDGAPDAAGAFIFPDTIERAASLALDPERALRENDSGRFFAALQDQLVTGPTGTNVNDLRIILIDP